MEGGEQDVKRTEQLDAEETLVRFVESPWSDPRAVVQRSDLAANLDGAPNRCRRHLGRLAAAQVVVLPQLRSSAIGRAALTVNYRFECDWKGGALS